MAADQREETIAAGCKRLAAKGADDPVHHEGRPAPPRDAGDLHLQTVQRGLIAPRFVDERPRARLADPLVEVQAERDGVLRAEIELPEGRLIVGADARAAGEQDEREKPQRVHGASFQP